ncbi:hypothetical protein Unana1_01758 [Umbelopsis nana]
MDEEITCLLPSEGLQADRPVHELIEEVKNTVNSKFETSMSPSALGLPEINVLVVEPIIKHWRGRKEPAAVFAWLSARCDYLKDSYRDLGNTKVLQTRADVCEVVAIRLLKAYSPDMLILVLTHDFAPKQTSRNSSTFFKMYDRKDKAEISSMNALEVAIEGFAKNFVASPLVQRLVDDIWRGNIVFFASAIDHPSSRIKWAYTLPSQTVDRAKVPLPTKLATVNHADPHILRLSRLRVPRYKAFFETLIYCVFVFCYSMILYNDICGSLNGWEILFDFFVIGYTINEVTQFANAPSYYFQNLWNAFDVGIFTISFAFIGLRIQGFTQGTDTCNLAYDVLAINAMLLWPRLLSSLDSLPFFGTFLIIIRRMLIDSTIFFTLLAVFFLGFLQTFYALGRATYSWGEIGNLMLKIMLGSQFLGFEAAPNFGPFGQPVMSFSSIISNAHEEFLFLMCIKTVEQIQSDELFEYMPPFNLIQAALLLPLKQMLPDKIFLKVNRAVMCILFLPFLLIIYLWEVFSARWNKEASQQFVVQRVGTIKPMYRRTAFRARTRSTTAAPRISPASAVPPTKIAAEDSLLINVDNDSNVRYGALGKQKSSATLCESPTQTTDMELGGSSSQRDDQLAEIKMRCEALQEQVHLLLAAIQEMK